MPGSIRVSVLNCVDLPAEATGGKYVSMKVGVGKREFQTKPSNVDGNKTAVWNSDFSFPVLNLQDNLMVILLDSDGNAISQTEILTPVIVEKGSLEEQFPLKGGGRVHLKLSFVLTLEERMRIEAMRESALEKKERRTVKKNAIQIMKPLEENKTSASDAAKGILQTIPENSESKDDSQNEKNHITPIVVPQVSLSNEMQNEKKSIREAPPAPISPASEYVTHQENKTESIDEGLLAPTSLPIEHDTHKEASSYESKKISVYDLEENRHQHPPPDIEESGTTGSSKEFTVLKDTSSPSFDQTSGMPSEPISLVEVDGTANVLSVKTSSEEDMASSPLSTPPSVIPSQSSTDGSMSPTPLVDSPNNAKGEKSIPFPNYFPGSSQLDQMFHIHQSIDSIETQASSIAYDVANPHKGIGIPSHSDSSLSAENTIADHTESYVINAERTEVVARAFGPVESSTNRRGSVACGATEGPCERSSLSLHTVPSQSSSIAGGQTESVSSNIVNLIDSRVNTVVSTASSKPAASKAMKGSAVKAKIKAFENALSSQTMRGDGRKNSVKAKIKAFESNLTQDPDYHNLSPRKINHKIEAERAWQRLQAEAAAAEAAEAKRRAEEEELILKSSTDARERKSGLPHRSYESRVRTMVKLKRQYMERNEDEDKRQRKEDVKNITVAKDDRKIHDTYRDKEVRTRKLNEKWPEIGERKIKPEDMTALRRTLKERGENLLRVETKEKTAEENPRSIALNWERMKLAEFQREGNLQYDTLQSDLSAKQKELVEEPTVSEMLTSQSSKTFEQKQDVGVQAGQSELYNHDSGKSVSEARWIANEKAKQNNDSDHELIIDQRVHSVTKRESPEEEDSLSEKELEDLVNGSAAFGGFIKQLVGAAALLATGALFMWIRGERTNRRSRRIQPNYRPYFLSNDAVTSRID